MVKGPEDDPNDDSVGLGGLPNEEGVVELDSCCMHGPTRRAGSVGGVRNIKNVSMVAKAVMEHTGHVMLVGEGAERFAVGDGTSPREPADRPLAQNLDAVERIQFRRDWWGPGSPIPMESASSDSQTAGDLLARPHPATSAACCRSRHRAGISFAAVRRVLFPPTGTIHCSALNEKGEMSGITTTSGLAFKLPGRVGDSPIIGAGCYTDQDVGSAGATGAEKKTSRLPALTPLSRTCGTACLRRKPAWTR